MGRCRRSRRRGYEEVTKRLPGLLLAAALTALLPVQAAVAASGFSLQSAMQSAATNRGVPLPLVEAVAYVNSRWEVTGRPSGDGGVGPMHVMPAQLAQAATLSGHSTAQITTDPAANVDAGAALLANAHTGGTDLASWRAATEAVHGHYVANQIYKVLQTGASRTTSTGELIALDPQPAATTSTGPAAPAAATVQSPDYPPASWVPADPANYTVAN